jgi:hypothetical protein
MPPDQVSGGALRQKRAEPWMAEPERTWTYLQRILAQSPSTHRAPDTEPSQKGYQRYAKCIRVVQAEI